MTDATLLTYEEIKTGEVFAFQRTISQEDVLVFSKLTGDRSPLHINEEFGKNSKFGKNVVHGMLIGALFSTLIGMHCPGKKSLYMSQTLQFKLPLFAGDTVTVKGTVISKHDAIRIVTIKTEVFRGNDMIVTGEAKTQVVEY
jgi:3-hydroxybutyryl-CoA dehydratase